MAVAMLVAHVALAAVAAAGTHMHVSGHRGTRGCDYGAPKPCAAGGVPESGLRVAGLQLWWGQGAATSWAA